MLQKVEGKGNELPFENPLSSLKPIREKGSQGEGIEPMS